MMLFSSYHPILRLFSSSNVDLPPLSLHLLQMSFYALVCTSSLAFTADATALSDTDLTLITALSLSSIFLFLPYHTLYTALARIPTRIIIALH
jgi:hypothetical protein